MMKTLPHIQKTEDNTSVADTQKIMASFQNSNPKLLNSVLTTIKKLNDLKDRNWSMKDLNVNRIKPKLRPHYQNRVGTTETTRQELRRLSNKPFEQPSLRKLHTSGMPQFQEAQCSIKPYGVSNETFATAWKDRGAVQLTSNHESASFNVISHSNNNCLNLKSKLNENPYLCRKSKGIAEYNDLTRVTASKLNECYQGVIGSKANAFVRNSGNCAKDCDNGKKFGPGFNFFKR